VLECTIAASHEQNPIKPQILIGSIEAYAVNRCTKKKNVCCVFFTLVCVLKLVVK
jgi:hypothetical protein